MGEVTAIGWTDHTFNAWIGCTEAGPGCDLCYARQLDKLYQWGVPPGIAADNRLAGRAPHWGLGIQRYRTSPATWRNPIKWNAAAAARGRPAKVFCNSLSDVFDNEVPQAWREDLFALWRATPWLRWQAVTKRVPNIAKMLPADWGPTGYPNVGLVATTVNQAEFNRDAPRLLKIPAPWHGFSMEPQIGWIVLPPELLDHEGALWFITGGESDQEPKAKVRKLPEPRFWSPGWATSLITAAGYARNEGLEWRVYTKQTGARPEGMSPPADGMGKDPSAWPAQIRVQEFVAPLLS